jgi:hypothetical protein
MPSEVVGPIKHDPRPSHLRTEPNLSNTAVYLIFGYDEPNDFKVFYTWTDNGELKGAVAPMIKYGKRGTRGNPWRFYQEATLAQRRTFVDELVAAWENDMVTKKIYNPVNRTVMINTLNRNGSRPNTKFYFKF